MRIFLCGRGRAADTIVHMLREQQRPVAVFGDEDVNDTSLWPFPPDLVASIGYLHIIRQHVIGAARGRVINCHYALLPNHRGRSAVPWAIVDGDTVTGITYHRIDAGIDTGPILLQASCQIDSDDTQATLFDKLHDLAIAYWPTAMHLAWLGTYTVPQVGQSQYHRAGPPHGGEIDPTWGDAYVERFIRAMTYPPKPYAQFRGREIRTFDEYVQVRNA